MLFGLFGKKKDKRKAGVLIGTVVHYFPKVKAAVVKIKKDVMSVGDRIRIKGHTTDIEQTVKSMQIQHEAVESASKGQEVAIKVRKRARIGDQLFMVRSGKGS